MGLSSCSAVATTGGGPPPEAAGENAGGVGR